MTASAAFSQPTESDLLQRATWLAATLGPFDPAELVGHLTEEPAARRFLVMQLAPLCAEVSTSEAVLWNLKADPRRQALSEMQSQGVLGQTTLPDFVEAVQAAPQDRFGRYLREALTGKTDVDELSEPEGVDARYAAYEFVGRAEVGAAPLQVRDSASLVEQGAQRTAADERLAQTVGPAFVGRVLELQALEEFAVSGQVSAPQFQSPAPRPVHMTPMVFINGIGGAGKSAMIARFVQLMRAQSTEIAATVILDFDRPTLSSLNRLELTFELIRQISFSLPQITPELLELRRTALSEFSDVDISGGSGGDTGFQLDARALYSIHSRLREILERVPVLPLNRPFLIILDTFEEVLALGEPFVRAIYTWLEDLRTTGGFRNLRVIVSGRAVPADLLQTTDANVANVSAGAQGGIPANVVAEIPLGDLETDEALELLTRRGVEAKIAAQLIGRFGRNPLVLRLLWDYSTQKGTAAARKLVRSKRSREQYRAEVAQRILYSRILGRIRNEPGLKALASPGLVVRVVTPGLIREVLAGPCGLGRISATRAKELFTKLASQVWLVRRIGNGVIAHRRDMRAVMLPLVTEPARGGNKARLVKQVREIHQNALEYHRSRKDENLQHDASFNEEIYHQLFVEPEHAFERRVLELALTSLAGDLSDFPPLQQARLKIRLGRSLTDEELELLSAREVKEYKETLRSLDVRNVGSAAAVEFGTAETTKVASKGPPPFLIIKAPVRALAPDDDDAIATAFARGEFERVARICGDVLSVFVNRCSSGGDVGLPPDISSHVTWMAALATLSGEKLAPSAQWLEDFCERVSKAWNQLRHRQLGDRSELSVAHYLTALAILLSRCRPLPAAVIRLLKRIGEDARGEVRFEITSTGALRIFQLLVTTLPHESFHPMPRAVNASSLQYFAGLLDPRYARKLDPSLYEVQRAWATALRESQTGGGWASPLRGGSGFHQQGRVHQ